MNDNDMFGLAPVKHEGHLAVVDEGAAQSKLSHGMKVAGLLNRIESLRRQGYGVVEPEVMKSRWRRLLWAFSASPFTRRMSRQGDTP